MAAPKPKHTIGILGVRDHNGVVYANFDYVARILDEHVSRLPAGTEYGVLTGGGRGTESLVLDWCKARKITVRTIPPSITKFGQKKAFAVRNNNIVAESDDVLVFWDGYTEVTIEAIMSAMHMQKRVSVIPLL